MAQDTSDFVDSSMTVGAVSLEHSGGDPLSSYEDVMYEDSQNMEYNDYLVNSVWSGDGSEAVFTGAVFPENSGDSDDDDDPEAVRIHEEYVLSPATLPP
jgi:hypothetical protein